MQAPKDRNDDRYIHEGSSKMVWKLDDFAVINAYDRQRFRDLKGTEDEKIQQSNQTIMMEYNFTLYLNSIFPALIPKVYLFKDPYPFEDKRFRYVKDFCTMVKNDEGLFDKLIKVSDILLDKGWVYLDIKPENISEQNGQLSIMDTDYKSLYKVPEDMIPDFRKWVYMIVLIYSYNNLTIIDPKTLIEFIKKKGIHTKMLRELRPKFSIEPWKEISKEIIEYGNNLFRDAKKEDYIQLNYIMDPYTFFEAYGATHNKTCYERLAELMELAYPTKAEAPAETDEAKEQKVKPKMEIPKAVPPPTSSKPAPIMAGAQPKPASSKIREAKPPPKPQAKKVIPNPIAEAKTLPNDETVSYKQEDDVVPTVDTLFSRMSSRFGLTQKNKPGDKRTTQKGLRRRRKERMVS